MAVSLLLGVLGLLEVLAPKRVVDLWYELATEGDDHELRSWVYTAARIEGVLILLWILSRRRRRSGET
ncbi:hypothetical protein ACFQJD_10640 [Haloplanus sp. GCM10025708]|uniref:hypothetical protein n=1 Tax=Haloferacaceae TaxID=1644056 RepID=UPI003608BA76